MDYPQLRIGEGSIPLNMECSRSLSEHEIEVFNHLRKEDKQKLVMLAPLPSIKDAGKLSAPNIGKGFIATTVTYMIENTTYKLHRQYYKGVIKYTVKLNETNQISDLRFQEMFTNPFLATFQRFTRSPFLRHLSPLFHEAGKLTLKESDIERALEETLYSNIQNPLLYNLDLNRDFVLQNVNDFLNEKGYQISNPQNLSSVRKISPVLKRGGDYSADFLGMLFKPDLICGYQYELSHIVSITAMGETKLPSLNIKENIFCFVNNLSRPKRLSPINFDKILKKLITTGIHCGCPRLLLNNYNEYLLISLDPEFSEYCEDQPNEVLIEKSQSSGEDHNEGNSHTNMGHMEAEAEENKTDCTNGVGEIVDGDQESENEEDSGLFCSETEETIINCHHHLVSYDDPFVRLKIAAFLHLNPNLVDELIQFQHNVLPILKEELENHLAKYNKEGETSKDSTYDTSLTSFGTSTRGSTPKRSSRLFPDFPSPSSSKRSRPPTGLSSASSGLPPSQNTGGKYQDRGENVDLGLLTPSTASFSGMDIGGETYLKVDGGILSKYIELKLGSMVTAYLHCGEHRKQVVVVSSELFIDLIPSECCLSNVNIPTQLAVGQLVVKIFDPDWFYWRTIPRDCFLQEEFNDRYQKMINRIWNELTIYSKLSKLQGNLIPRIYCYGTLDDVEVSIGKPYIRCFGPYLAMDDLTSLRHCSFQKRDIDKNFLVTKIIPAYRRLHELCVVHNDISYDNLIITTDEEIRICDFDKAFITNDKSKFEEEIANLYEYFGV